MTDHGIASAKMSLQNAKEHQWRAIVREVDRHTSDGITSCKVLFLVNNEHVGYLEGSGYRVYPDSKLGTTTIHWGDR